MVDQASDLAVGEVIEIKYRVPQRASADRQDPKFFERWILAEIIHQDGEALPIARLADGQFTDIRAYMVWRRISTWASTGGPEGGH